jgi:2-polyprenyl-3-methyl-5-hydroxy-6-metoxy-1,4-benzoquinol methylase
MTTHEQIKDKWNKEEVPNTFRHIEIDLDKLNSIFKKYVTDVLDVKDKTVIDYGIGGGWLGKLLLSDFGVKKYIGYDVCDNSLDFARENLKDFNNKRVIQVRDFIDFSKVNADIFISLECIQHFPDEDYLKTWLTKVNESGCNDLILQYKFGNNVKFQSKNVYTFACTLTKNYMDKYLTNYKNWGRFKVFQPTINKEYVYFKKVK